jgi:hypothetical protein
MQPKETMPMDEIDDMMQELPSACGTCLLVRYCNTLPAEGERVRISLLRDMQSWQGNRLVTTPSGTIWEGIVVSSDPEGFFDIRTDDEQPASFYINDSSFRVEKVVKKVLETAVG